MWFEAKQSYCLLQKYSSNHLQHKLTAIQWWQIELFNFRCNSNILYIPPPPQDSLHIFYPSMSCILYCLLPVSKDNLCPLLFDQSITLMVVFCWEKVILVWMVDMAGIVFAYHVTKSLILFSVPMSFLTASILMWFIQETPAIVLMLSFSNTLWFLQHCSNYYICSYMWWLLKSSSPNQKGSDFFVLSCTFIIYSALLGQEHRLTYIICCYKVVTHLRTEQVHCCLTLVTLGRNAFNMAVVGQVFTY